MTPQTFFITGATGLLGRHIVDDLLRNGKTVRALVPFDECSGAAALRTRGAAIVNGDLREAASFARDLDAVDCVIHAGARTGVRGAQAAFDAVNVTGTLELLQIASTAGVRRFVHISSITVHGNDLRGAGDEGAPFREEPNPYSRSKLAAERRLRTQSASRTEIVYVRPGWIYGAGDSASFARIVARIEAGRMPLVGTGRNIVPLIEVRDAARATILAAVAGAPGRDYIVVNDEPVTQRAYLEAIAEQLMVAAPRHSIPYGLALALGAVGELMGRLRESGPPLSRYGFALLGGENRYSIARARRELSFAPAVAMRDGVRDGVAWWRSILDRRAA